MCVSEQTVGWRIREISTCKDPSDHLDFLTWGPAAPRAPGAPCDPFLPLLPRSPCANTQNIFSFKPRSTTSCPFLHSAVSIHIRSLSSLSQMCELMCYKWWSTSLPGSPGSPGGPLRPGEPWMPALPRIPWVPWAPGGPDSPGWPWSKTKTERTRQRARDWDKLNGRQTHS